MISCFKIYLNSLVLSRNERESRQYLPINCPRYKISRRYRALLCKKIPVFGYSFPKSGYSIHNTHLIYFYIGLRAKPPISISRQATSVNQNGKKNERKE